MNPVIINQAGPLPIKATVPWPSSNTVMVAVSGSAWTENPDSNLVVNVIIQGTQVGTLQQFANVTSTHLAFPTAFIAVQENWGEVTVALTPANGSTITDQNDHFTVALLY